jgi:hypothetical protein
VVEHSLGKGEVESSILSGSTSFCEPEITRSVISAKTHERQRGRVSINPFDIQPRPG